MEEPMSSLNAFLADQQISVIRTEQTRFPDGTVQSNPIAYIPGSLIDMNPRNNRFRPKEDLTSSVQEKMLREQHPEVFASLVKSMTDNPCFEAMKLLYTDGKFVMIDGHRRLLAGKDAKRQDYLAIIYTDLSEENFDYLAEWNEENDTKLPHESFYQARGIALPLITAKDDADRQKILERFKRRGLKDQKINRAVDTVLYIQEFSKITGEPEEKRADQYKAFETVAATRKQKFEGLRNIGEFEKIEALENLSVDFLKANLAHDDIKVALDGLAERSMEDPIWQMIEDKEIDVKQTSGLRRIVNEIRATNTTHDLVAEAKAYSQRLYGRLLASPEVDTIKKVRLELAGLVSKLDVFCDSMGGAT
jgi:hypothetical protein